MESYLHRSKTILAVKEELNIASHELILLSGDQLNVLAEFCLVLSEVRRVSRELEAEKKYLCLGRLVLFTNCMKLCALWADQ